MKGGSSRFHRDNVVISCPGTGNWLHVRGGGGTPALRPLFGRGTLRCCPGQFLSHEVNGYF